jgi:hypothetical protein
MKIVLTAEESENIFMDALCNGAGYLSGYGLSLDYEKSDYTKAKESLLTKNPDAGICREDVWMEILKIGGKLNLIDQEDPDEIVSITIQSVHERVMNTDSRHLLDAINESGDAITADCILQTVFLKGIVYG